ncbi:MAG TPA: VOC family protein [Candidatus Acidoferrales bacterium]|nr:VOC family protein [Candidatus Acidoferrales bacterium]
MPRTAKVSQDRLTFNHAMVYSRDVQRALGFYRDLLGFKLVDEFRHENRPVYARLRAPGGDGTLALHLADAGTPIVSDGVRLYFEIRELEDFCRKLQAKGFYITQMPRMMPWGWLHAYLNDPDGHEISLYWAGENRMKKTVMRTAKQIEERK